ncbi:hypothetical protein [Nitratireductor aquibiodomus]|uniref:hypothetical protein n=1 Tax=Nitratireductor aquibiodomus TaxID=204799 RepID=UPI000B7C9881|nr:hypothetical protein [Nitratireductor aquibiodomus]
MEPGEDILWIGLPVSGEMVAELGQFIAQWGFMETYLNMLVLSMMARPQTDEEMRHLPMALKKRLALLKGSAQSRFPECPSLVERIRHIATEIKLLKPDREAIAHGMWSSRDATSVSITTFHNQKWSSKSFTLYQIRQRSIAVSALSRRIMAILNAGSLKGTDWAFPLPPHEIDAIRTAFCRIPPPPHTRSGE